jgi:hypothetical protein
MSKAKSKHIVTQAQSIEALRVMSTLASQIPESFPPFAYGAPPNFAMTPGNALPALVVWLFLVTNPEFLATLEGSPQAIPGNVPVDEIAAAVNLTPACVNEILAVYTPSNNQHFRAVAAAFQAYATQSLYTRPNCPGGPAAMIQLATKGAAVDPNALTADPIGS